MYDPYRRQAADCHLLVDKFQGRRRGKISVISSNKRDYKIAFRIILCAEIKSEQMVLTFLPLIKFMPTNKYPDCHCHCGGHA